MDSDFLSDRLDDLGRSLDGDLKHDNLTRIIYSTDASVYRECPAAVIWPRGVSDIKKIIAFANREKISITVRAAGTSLAGQVVSSGIIVDISRYMTRIIEINEQGKWAKVEPGVVLDELNLELRKYGLFFGPETSTSNRCNIGGMVGNNACGSHSVIYGSTRDHLLELSAILSDGSEVYFGPLGRKEFEEKCLLKNLEGDLYRNIREILNNPVNRKNISEGFPDPSIPRRNTGYAVDLLLGNAVFGDNPDQSFNFCKLLAGSEGTLAIITEIKLKLVSTPPPHKVLLCVHLEKRNDAFKANLIALKHHPTAVEMMDDRILALTENNLSQRENRFFLDGKPAAILIIELAGAEPEDVDMETDGLIADLKSAGYGYAFPVVKGKDINKVWDLRKAGLGVLSNMKGDSKPVSLIEDTAIGVEQMPEFISDFEKMLSSYGKEVVYHAHIGTGELHIRPVLNLKEAADVELFRTLGFEMARLVKKYHGSMSGEHGDGRLRGEFIPIIIGENNYELLKNIKKCWDPLNILNPGKITDTPQMNTFLRYIPGKKTREIETIYDFSATDGIIRAAEKCNGSGDCRKSKAIGGTMCPTFMATGEERNDTRARANILREFLNRDDADPWDHREIYEILDLCIECKGCKSECPSGVDMAKLKSEFLQHWYDRHGIPLRTLMIGYISALNKAGSVIPQLFNFLAGNRFTSLLIKKTIGFATGRSIPLLYKTTLRRWAKRNLKSINPESPVGSVCFFVDEFTDYNDTEIGIAALRLLTSLSYKVVIVPHHQSARTFISKGLIRKAASVARKNISIFAPVVNGTMPLVGLEPSAILSFRDEYPDLAGDKLKIDAERISRNSYTIEEFVAREFRSGKIRRNSFVETHADVLVHVHCQQKAVSSSSFTIEMLSIPVNYKVSEIPSGCCGMAGSFGYEKEHFALSNLIGEMVLFPAVRNSETGTIIAASGTSCRHQIKDGTSKSALHPAEVLYMALRK